MTTASPNPDPDFSEIGERFSPEVEAELQTIWTLVCRGWASGFFDLEPEEAERILDVYLLRDDYLTGHECQQIEMFRESLGKCRPSSRSFDSLTAVEHSLLTVLRRGSWRAIAADQEGDE